MPRPPDARRRLRLSVDRGDDGDDPLRLLRRADRARTAGPRPRVALPAGRRVRSPLLGFARLYLGAHWLSDVVGGVLFGIVWLLVLGIAYRRHVARSFWMRPLALGFLRRVRGRRAVACAARDRADAGALRAAAAATHAGRERLVAARLGAPARAAQRARRRAPLAAGRAVRRRRWRRCSGALQATRLARAAAGGLDRDAAACSTTTAPPREQPVLPATLDGRPKRCCCCAPGRARADAGRLRLWPAPARLARWHAAVARHARRRCITRGRCGVRAVAAVADDGAAHAAVREALDGLPQLRESRASRRSGCADAGAARARKPTRRLRARRSSAAAQSSRACGSSSAAAPGAAIRCSGSSSARRQPTQAASSKRAGGAFACSPPTCSRMRSQQQRRAARARAAARRRDRARTSRPRRRSRPLSRTRVRATWKRRAPRTRSVSRPSSPVPKSSIRASVPNAAGVAGAPASSPSRIRQTPKPRAVAAAFAHQVQVAAVRTRAAPAPRPATARSVQRKQGAACGSAIGAACSVSRRSLSDALSAAWRGSAAARRRSRRWT